VRTLNFSGVICDTLNHGSGDPVSAGYGIAASSPDNTASGWGQLTGSIANTSDGKLVLPLQRHSRAIAVPSGETADCEGKITVDTVV